MKTKEAVGGQKSEGKEKAGRNTGNRQGECGRKK